MPNHDDLAANLAKATATEAPAKSPDAKPKASVPKPTAKPAAPKPPPVATAAPSATYEPDNPKQPARPGTPCQVKGCLGRYSILQSRKVGTTLVRSLICRTCKHQPAPLQPVAPTIATPAKPAK